MTNPITIKRLNYYRLLAKAKAKKNKSCAANTPKKKKKKTIRERMNAASLTLFNRKDKGGNKLCRNIFCSHYTKDGYYCSITCKKKFFAYYEDNYMWANIRLKVFKRDNFRCFKCKRFFQYKIGQLECDHIKPISMLKEYGYKTLNLKAFDEYIYNPQNLRTTCKECHKDITNAYMKEWRKLTK